ncbi:TonB-dependent receptor [Sphingomonas sp. C3-2]|uniref:TonB-dependent receptor n=1 Tax=Sphingomonas sp. C3-2 TaxID=3062169 RepID=UPI00294ABE34|nr:TonB-dependent receptor [Sphingomonas sp. C3-2]WOK35279.1 TonB-dependent receptor [Sphingomonas sp. C3-2]
MSKASWMLSVACLALSAPALAQETTPPPEPTGANTATNEIIVTAQGRAQQLQDVPLAISAVSSETLQNSGANDIRQLNQLAPSLLVSSTGSEANGSARIRGIGTVGDNPGLESSVAVFIDGVYRSRTGVGLNELGEIERVEVLRGPQGTLFGRNASAGLLNIVSKRPEFEFGGSGEITYGNYDYWRLSGAVTGPITETIAARIDGVWSKRDGFYRDLVNDRDLNDRDRYFLRGQLLFEPSSDVRIRLIGDYTKRDESCCGAVYIRQNEVAQVGGLLDPAQNPIIGALIGTGQNPAAFTVNPYDRDLYVSEGRSYRGKTEDWGISGELNWDFDAVQLTAITAYRDYRSNQGSDTDYSQVDILYRDPGSSAYQREFRTFSQELRLQGSLFDDRLDWLVGGYFADEKMKLTDNLKFGRDYGRFAACRLVAAAGLPSVLINAANPGCLSAAGRGFVGSIPTAGPALLAGFDRLDAIRSVGDDDAIYRQKSTNYAFFTHNIFHVTDTIDLTLGVRWTKEIKKFRAEFNNDNVLCPVQKQNLLPLLAAGGTVTAIAGGLIGLSCQGNSSAELNALSLRDKIKDDQFTGTGVVSWKPNNDVMVYASFSKGYKAGGFNLDRSALTTSTIFPFAAPQSGFNVTNLRFDPEKVDAYEIGAKLAFKNFIFNISAFRQEFSNFQLNTFNGTVFLVQNINGCSNLVGGSGSDEDLSGATGACDPGDVHYGVRAQGIEVESSLSPSPYLRFNAGFTWARTKYRNDLVGRDTGVPLDPALRMLPGNFMSNAPEYVTTGSVTWTPPIGNSGLSGLFYVDTRLTSDYNTGSDLFPQKAQDGFAIVNARAGIRGEDERWAVEIWAQNLFNKGYTQVAFNSPFQQAQNVGANPNFPAAQFPGGTQIFSAFLAEPRTYGVTLRGKF